MIHTGDCTFVRAREQRNEELEELRQSLTAQFGPGTLRLRIVPDPANPQSFMGSPEFSNYALWRWTVAGD